LWALFDFLMPGCLGNQKLFNQSFRKPIEKHNNLEQRQRLVNRVAPFMLRRTKSEVVLELPDKTEIIRTVSLGKAQAALYESIRLSMEKKVREAIKNKGLKRSHITILDALLKLRQTCCDPKLLPLAQASKVKSSAKLEMLMEMLVEMLEEGRRILIFSQFTKMLGIIETELKSNKMSYSKLTGKTIHREKVIDEFKQGKSNIFLISLKAGGVGLNLTEADTVIHYDPWWNPAVENQATDRVHRIGQKKAVFVYKLITENTLEEKIIAMQAKKQALADGIYNEEKSAADSQLTANDLKELFANIKEPEKSDDLSQQFYSKAKFMGKHCQGQIEIKPDGISPTIRAEHHGNIEFRRLSKKNGGILTKELSKGLKERRLTPRECALIQTFPPDYEFVIANKQGRKGSYLVSPSKAYKVIGNAVPPLLAYNLAKRIENVWDLYF